jgi:hypothetical protein
MKIAEISTLQRKITRAARQAVRDAIENHLRSGNPIWVMKNGKLVRISSKQR